MPELPDLTIYVEALEARVLQRELRKVRISSPFVLRTVEPSPADLVGRRIVQIHLMGKRIVFRFDDDLNMVIHLMIAGRFRWEAPGAKIPRKLGLAALDFDEGTLILTEAGSKRRASIHILRTSDLAAVDRGGIDPLTAAGPEFGAALARENHTLKRALTDPRLFSGIGNAYSDEILHRARMSPLQLTSKLNEEQIERLRSATSEVLHEWIERLRQETGTKFPSKVTAFRAEMAAHGRFGQPCPVCGSPIQRIVYADNETNYCARCQTEGKVLRDRALSRLLREDWPSSLDD